VTGGEGALCVTSVQWGHPTAEAGAGQAAVTGTGAGVKPVTPSSGQAKLSPGTTMSRT